MPQIQRSLPATQNHATRDRVAIHSMARECVSLLLGARKQRRAPRDRGVHQLRRDIARDRNQCFESILRVALADLADGEDISDVTGAIYHMARSLEACAGSASVQMPLSESLKLAAKLRARETELAIDVLGGDESLRTLRELERTLERERDLIEPECEAVRAKMYRTAAA